MKSLSYFFIFAGALLILNSCYSPRYVYSPAAHNVPVLEKKGDSKLAANYSTNLAEDAVGFDIQGAYAFTKHWAAQVNYFYRKEYRTGYDRSSSNDLSSVDYRRNLTEIAIGYYRQLKKTQPVFFQVFAGTGFGKFGFTDAGADFNGVLRNRFHNTDITKLFIQPALQVKSRGSFIASFSSRYSLIYFKNIKTDYTATELENYKLDSLSYSPSLFWEPAMVFAFGHKKLPGINFEFQNGYSFLMSRRFVDYRSFNFSMGLLFDLPKLFAMNRRSSKN